MSLGNFYQDDKGKWHQMPCELGEDCPYGDTRIDLESASSTSVDSGATENMEGPQILRSTIAAEAQSAVYGERGKDYGHPRQNFADTAAIWTVLLGDRLSAPLTGEDVARCMVGLKLARDLHSQKRDNRVDGIGYFIALDRLITGD